MDTAQVKQRARWVASLILVVSLGALMAFASRPAFAAEGEASGTGASPAASDGSAVASAQQAGDSPSSKVDKTAPSKEGSAKESVSGSEAAGADKTEGLPEVDELPLHRFAVRATAEPVNFVLSVEKHLANRALKDDEFTFKAAKGGAYKIPAGSDLASKLQDDAVPREEKLHMAALDEVTYASSSLQPKVSPNTAQNNADGTVTFSAVTFDGSSLGTKAAQRQRGTIFCYKVTEKGPVTGLGTLVPGAAWDAAGSAVYDGVTYDDSVKKVYVYVYETTVKKQPVIKVMPLGLVSFPVDEETGDVNDAPQIGRGFVNVYGGAQVESYNGYVTLGSTPITDDEFSFEVHEVDSKGAEIDSQEVPCGADQGGVSGAAVPIIQNVTFTHPGTYYFAVRQIGPEGSSGSEDADEDDGWGANDDGSWESGDDWPWDDSDGDDSWDESWDDSADDGSEDGTDESDDPAVVETDDGTRIKLDMTSYLVKVEVTEDAGYTPVAKVTEVSKQEAGSEDWVSVSDGANSHAVVWNNEVLPKGDDEGEEGDGSDEDWGDWGDEDDWGSDDGDTAAHKGQHDKGSAGKARTVTKVKKVYVPQTVRATLGSKSLDAGASSSQAAHKATHQRLDGAAPRAQSEAGTVSGAPTAETIGLIAAVVVLALTTVAATAAALYFRRQLVHKR